VALEYSFGRMNYSSGSSATQRRCGFVAGSSVRNPSTSREAMIGQAEYCRAKVNSSHSPVFAKILALGLPEPQKVGE